MNEMISTGCTTPSPIAAATHEISCKETEARNNLRFKLRQLMRWTDGLIEELEQFNLAGIGVLPASWTARLQLLLSSLPFDFRRKLHAPLSPTKALDLIFDIQSRILESEEASSINLVEGWFTKPVTWILSPPVGSDRGGVLDDRNP
jgi:hypothetical protein